MGGKQVYYNTTDTPVVIDGEGRIVGGGEWVHIKPNPEVERALELGSLIETTVADRSQDADADASGEEEEAADDTSKAPTKPSTRTQKQER